MGAIRPPKKAVLFAGLLSGDEDLLRRAAHILQKHFGPVLATSDLWPFDQTDYYEAEMGPDLQRQFVAFTEMIDPGRLAEIKRETNDIEGRISVECVLPEGFRAVNIDPGYLTLSKMVLATTKDYSHRMYLGRGIYAEVTLHFESGRWQPWPWTYPDYASGRYDEFFAALREYLKERISAPDAGDKTR
jgi:hypothetical protein